MTINEHHADLRAEIAALRAELAALKATAMTEKPILNREEAAALMGVTLDRLASIEEHTPSLVRTAGVRLMYSGRPTIRYRRAALLAWLEGRAAE